MTRQERRGLAPIFGMIGVFAFLIAVDILAIPATMIYVGSIASYAVGFAIIPSIEIIQVAIETVGKGLGMLVGGLFKLPELYNRYKQRKSHDLIESLRGELSDINERLASMQASGGLDININALKGEAGALRAALEEKEGYLQRLREENERVSKLSSELKDKAEARGSAIDKLKRELAAAKEGKSDSAVRAELDAYVQAFLRLRERLLPGSGASGASASAASGDSAALSESVLNELTGNLIRSVEEDRAHRQASMALHAEGVRLKDSYQRREAAVYSKVYDEFSKGWQSHIDELQERISAYEKEVTTLRSALQSSEEHIETLEKAKAEMEQQNQRIMQGYNALRGSLQDSNNRMRALWARLQAVQSQNQRLMGRLEEARDRVARAGENSELADFFPILRELRRGSSPSRPSSADPVLVSTGAEVVSPTSSLGSDDDGAGSALLAAAAAASATNSTNEEDSGAGDSTAINPSAASGNPASRSESSSISSTDSLEPVVQGTEDSSAGHADAAAQEIVGGASQALHFAAKRRVASAAKATDMPKAGSLLGLPPRVSAGHTSPANKNASAREAALAGAEGGSALTAKAETAAIDKIKPGSLRGPDSEAFFRLLLEYKCKFSELVEKKIERTGSSSSSHIDSSYMEDGLTEGQLVLVNRIAPDFMRLKNNRDKFIGAMGTQFIKSFLSVWEALQVFIKQIKMDSATEEKFKKYVMTSQCDVFFVRPEVHEAEIGLCPPWYKQSFTRAIRHCSAFVKGIEGKFFAWQKSDYNDDKFGKLVISMIGAWTGIEMFTKKDYRLYNWSDVRSGRKDAVTRAMSFLNTFVNRKFIYNLRSKDEACVQERERVEKEIAGQIESKGEQEVALFILKSVPKAILREYGLFEVVKAASTPKETDESRLSKGLRLG